MRNNFYPQFPCSNFVFYNFPSMSLVIFFRCFLIYHSYIFFVPHYVICHISFPTRSFSILQVIKFFLIFAITTMPILPVCFSTLGFLYCLSTLFAVFLIFLVPHIRQVLLPAHPASILISTTVPFHLYAF